MVVRIHSGARSVCFCSKICFMNYCLVPFLFIVDCAFDGGPFEIISQFASLDWKPFIVVRYSADKAGGRLVEQNPNTLTLQRTNKFAGGHAGLSFRTDLMIR